MLGNALSQQRCSGNVNSALAARGIWAGSTVNSSSEYISHFAVFSGLKICCGSCCAMPKSTPSNDQKKKIRRFCLIRLYKLSFEHPTFSYVHGLLFMAHLTMLVISSVLTKKCEQSSKISKVIYRQNHKILHTKVSQKQFQMMPWIIRINLI